MKTINGHQIYDGDAAFVLPPDPRVHRLTLEVAKAAIGMHKQEFILEDWCALMREQGAVGSCVAQALASIGTLFDKLEMSTDFIYGNARSGSHEGLVADEALSFVHKAGNVTEAEMPGNTEVTAVIEKASTASSSMWNSALQHRIEGYAYLCGHNSPKRDDEAVLTALDLGWPIFTIVGEAARFYKTHWSGGDCLCDMDGTGGGSHGIVVIGYKYIGNKLYWRVRNSWGEWWGDKGYAWCEAGDNMIWSHMWAIYDSRQYVESPLVHPVLRKGDSGEEVRELQQKLTANGHTLGTIDSAFGTKTYNAVVAFQKANKLDPDGIVGSKTWAVLDALTDSDTIIIQPDEWTYPITPQARTYTSAKRSMRISKYYTAGDLWLDDSHTSIILHDNLLRALDAIINHYGADRLEWYSKNSIYRTRTSNTACGGASNSQHLYGTAADFWVIKDGKRLDMAEVAMWAEANLPYVNGIGIYNGTHMHIDVRTNGTQYWWIVTSNSNTPGFGGKPVAFKNGHRSPAIKRIQSYLNDNGYRNDAGKALTVDGVYGDNTVQAMKKCQKAQSATVDGTYGQETNKKTKIFAW